MLDFFIARKSGKLHYLVVHQSQYFWVSQKRNPTHAAARGASCVTLRDIPCDNDTPKMYTGAPLRSGTQKIKITVYNESNAGVRSTVRSHEITAPTTYRAPIPPRRRCRSLLRVGVEGGRPGVLARAALRAEKWEPPLGRIISSCKYGDNNYCSW